MVPSTQRRMQPLVAEQRGTRLSILDIHQLYYSFLLEVFPESVLFPSLCHKSMLLVYHCHSVMCLSQMTLLPKKLQYVFASLKGQLEGEEMTSLFFFSLSMIYFGYYFETYPLYYPISLCHLLHTLGIPTLPKNFA